MPEPVPTSANPLSPLPLPRRSVAAERADLGIAWTSAAIAGAVAISYVPESGLLMRMFVPLTFMVGYFLFAITRSRFSHAKVGDSVYFMGFLWTLWALIDLLIRKRHLTAAQLYIAFGYGLTATAAGMFLRLLLLQFFRSAEEQEEEAVDSIDERVRELTAALQRSQLEVASFQLQACETLDRWNRDFATRTEQTLLHMAQLATDVATVGKELTASITGIKTSVTATGRSFSALDSKLATATVTVFERLSGSISALEVQMLDLSKRLASIKVPDDYLARELKRMSDAVAQAVSPVGTLANETLEKLARSIGQVTVAVRELPAGAELKAAVQGAAGHLTAASKACGRLSEEATKSVSALDAVRIAAEQLTTSIGQSGDALGGEIQVVKRNLEGVLSTVHDLQAESQEVQKVLKEVVQFARTQLQ